jgi:molybdenum cofactor biosynthesis enzyme MoaA
LEFAQAHKTPIKDVEFMPLSEFKEAAKRILSVSKEQSDKQIEDYQAELKQRRKDKTEEKGDK